MTSERGSTWNKWDLHVHSPASFHHEFGLDRDLKSGEDPDDAVWDRYLNELEQLDDISCVGITDYFSVEGYKRVRKEMEENGRLDNLDLVIPNVELRVNNFVEDRHSGSGDAVEVHVLFSDDLAPSTIQTEFLENIPATRPDGGEITLNKENLEELGNDPRYEDAVHDDDPYIRGCKLVTIQWKEILEALDREKIAGKSMSLVVKRDAWDNHDWTGRSGSGRSQFVSKADAFFVQTEEDRQWFLGKGRDFTPDKFERFFGSQVPAIRGSDSHDFETFCQPKKDRFCWIKADTTWGGLEQIKYEPETRVRIGKESPQRRVSIHTPDTLSINNGRINDRLEIEETTLPLNANLVTVIGGKGAGKTALLDLLANCFQNQHVPQSDVDDDANSFIRRAQTADTADSVRTRLEFAGENVEAFEKNMLDSETITQSQVEYLPQGEIEEHCRDDKKMHKKVLELVKEAMRTNHSTLLDDFQTTQTEIEELVDEIEGLTNSLHELGPETIEKRIRDVNDDINVIDGDIEDKEEEIEEFSETHKTELQEESIDKLESDLQKVTTRLKTARALRTDLESQQETVSAIEEYNERARSIEQQASSLDLDISPNRIEHSRLTDEVNDHLDRVLETIDRLEARKSHIQRELDGLQDVNGELSQLRTERRQLEKEREELEQHQQELEETKDRIQDIRETRRKKFKQYFNLYNRLRNQYGTMITHFEEGKADILEDVDFRATLQLDEGVQSSLFELLDGRSVNYEELTAVNQLEEATELPDDLDQCIDDYLDAMLSYNDRLKRESSLAEYEQRVFGDHVTLDERILLDGTPMDRLSLGQKGTVLLKILLVEDDRPLIIDQPEENLDNHFVYKTLKDAFREAKTVRQVIIATHNANLVVNTDSEQVIVAKYKDNTISFTSGALENPNIRSDVAEILEGGERAFMRREEKYGFSRE